MSDPDDFEGDLRDTHSQDDTDVAFRLASDGLRQPRILTGLRRWAIENEAVRRIDLSHEGGSYALAVLTDETSFDKIALLTRSLRLLTHQLFPSQHMPYTYFTGIDDDLKMFDRPGAITVLDKNQELRK